MKLFAIATVLDDLKASRPYSEDTLRQICEAFDGQPSFGLSTAELRQGMTGFEKTLWAWNGRLSEYLVPVEWMQKLEQGSERHTLAEAILVLELFKEHGKWPLLTAALQ